MVVLGGGKKGRFGEVGFVEKLDGKYVWCIGGKEWD